MYFTIILSSLFISTLLSVWIFNKTNQKLLSIIATFLINTLIIGTSTWAINFVDVEAKIFGISNSGYYYLIFTIPIISWISAILILVWAKKGTEQQV
ncbi:hypothetical protein [Ornithinibacillus californiensis]|uniref:hypothetical protein n=1 Tax=Ornithinibacillus californiensis TaxID=161536 RepID=UPI00064D949D|nr:hypothetical protein [Ornithinibacillus californiensis]